MRSVSFGDLQHSIEKVIGRIGLERTINLLESFISNTKITVNETEKVRLISDFLIASAIKSFELDENLFYTCNLREYKEARMCCYHLLRKYTDSTYDKIAKVFKQKPRIVMYGYFKVEERLSIPQSYAFFISNYRLLDSKILEFLGKLN